MSNLRDDWMVCTAIPFICRVNVEYRYKALNCTMSEEGDPVFSCIFKTELSTHLLQLTQASINVLIGPT